MKPVALLGPEYSYSHLLAKQVFPGEKFTLCSRIKDIFQHVVEGSSSLGIIPIENMLQGTVRESIMSLLRFKVKINIAYNFPISHCLASQSANYAGIISHSQALAQCSNFLESNFTGKNIIECSSTSKAMELAAKDKTLAAIGSREAAQGYGLQVLQETVCDNPFNVTRFFIISKEEFIAEGNVRTSLLLNPKEDYPGLLFLLLAPFAVQHINFTKIESLPSGRKFGEYIFYVEIEGSLNDLKVQKAIDFLRVNNEVYLFGTYNIVDLTNLTN